MDYRTWYATVLAALESQDVDRDRLLDAMSNGEALRELYSQGMTPEECAINMMRMFRDENNEAEEDRKRRATATQREIEQINKTEKRVAGWIIVIGLFIIVIFFLLLFATFR